MNQHLRAVNGQAKRKVGRPKGKDAPHESEWGGVDDEYSPNEFYTASCDNKGHDRTMQLRVPTNMAGMIAELVQSNRFPDIRTTSDFFRDAAVHRLHYIHTELDPTEVLEQDISRALADAKVNRIRERLAQDRALVDTVNEQLADLASQGDEEAFDYLAQISLESVSPISEAMVSRMASVIARNRAVLEATLAGRGN